MSATMSGGLRLLQTEIDVVPGRRPQQPTAEGVLGMGSAVVRIHNTTSQENSYTVRVKCEDSYWQEAWCTISPLPPAHGNENAPPPGKADQAGPQGRSLRVYVSSGGTRDVQINIQTPVKPDSRAGKYALRVQVETSVSGDTMGRGRDRFTELPAVAVVRPFYKWDLDIAPEAGRRLGIVRRSAEVEAVLTNEGNDWLYCDLKLPKPKDLLLDTPALRIAVPPPEPGEERTQRTIPVYATTRLRAFRGEAMVQPLQVVAQRADAPSVPPLPEDAPYSPVSANLGMAVLMTETAETRQAPGDRAVTYCPPIPSTLTGLVGSLVRNGKGLVLAVIGLIVAANMAFFMYEQVFRNAIVAEPLSMQAAPGGQLVIAGKFLTGAEVLADGKTSLPAKITSRESNHNPIAASILRLIPGNEQQYLAVTIPETYNGRQIKFTVRRGGGALPYLSPFLPKYECRSVVQVGSPPKAVVAPEVIPVSGSYKAGQSVEVLGRALGSSGKVYLGGKPDSRAVWSAEKIRFTIPKTALPGSSLGVLAVTADGRQLNAGSVTVVEQLSPALQQAQQVQQLTQGAERQQMEQGGAGGGSGAGGSGDFAGTVSAGLHEVGREIDAYAPLLHEDMDKALADADRAIKQDKNDADAHAVKAYVLAGEGKNAEALQEAEQAERLTHAEKTGRSRALALTAVARLGEIANPSDDDKVLQDYFEAIKADPTLELPFIAAGGYLVEQRQLFIAENYLELALKVASNPGILHYKLARVQALLNKNDRARRNAIAAKRLAPDIAEIPSFRKLAREIGLKE